MGDAGSANRDAEHTKQSPVRSRESRFAANSVAPAMHNSSAAGASGAFPLHSCCSVGCTIAVACCHQHHVAQCRLSCVDSAIACGFLSHYSASRIVSQHSTVQLTTQIL